MRSPVNTANGHLLKFPTHTILYNLTSLIVLILPLEKIKTVMTFEFQLSLSFTYQTAGFLNFHYRALIATSPVSCLNCKAIELL